MNRPAHPTETLTPVTGRAISAEAHDTPERIAAAISSLAANSEGRTEFLERLAVHLAEWFAAGLVAVTDNHRLAPKLWVPNDEFTAGLESASLEQLLDSAPETPATCRITPRATGRGIGEPRRGIHIRLPEPHSECSLLILYQIGSTRDAAAQFTDLKTLSLVSQCCASGLAHLAASPRIETPCDIAPLSQSTGIPPQLLHFHRDLNLQATCYRIANETRRLLDFDRVSVCTIGRKRATMAAISGVAVIDRRSNAVVAAETFATRATVLGRSLDVPGDEMLPPQINEAVERYLDATDVSGVRFIPLYRPAAIEALESLDDLVAPGSAESFLQCSSREGQTPIAALLLETFRGQPRRVDQHAIATLCDEAASALANAMEHERVFGLQFWKRVGDVLGGRRLPYSLLATAAAIALLTIGLVTEIDHKIVASGSVEPALQQHVFTRTDGIVKEVFVRDGQRVAAGDPLLRLENAELESQAENLVGQIQTSQRRLASLRSLLVDPTTDAKQAARIAVESRQLESELAGFEMQRTLIEKQRSELSVHSPIAGVVGGWNLQRKLIERPVSRGDQLMTVFDRSGPWHVRLEIDDKDSDAVSQALQCEEDLRVEFAIASHPEQTFSASLRSIGSAAHRNAQGMNVIDAEASVTSESFDPQQTRAGTEATAKIHCGRRSIVASWFGDIGDFFHRNVGFYLR